MTNLLHTSDSVLVICLHNSGSYFSSARYPSMTSRITFLTLADGNFLVGPIWYVFSNRTGGLKSWCPVSSVTETVLIDLEQYRYHINNIYIFSLKRWNFQLKKWNYLYGYSKTTFIITINFSMLKWYNGLNGFGLPYWHIFFSKTGSYHKSFKHMYF